MLSRGQLEALKDVLPFRNYDQLLQDYILEKVLYHIGVLWFDNVVLIGGTALSKFYGVPRFSKDIDITFVGISDETYRLVFDAIRERLLLEGFDVKDIGSPLKSDCWYFHAYEVSAPTLGVTGLSIQVRRVSSLIEHRIFERVPAYPDIFEYKLRVASLREILREKIKAIHDLSRHQVRDLFDIFYIVRKYNFDLSGYIESMEKFCKIAKSLLRYWGDLKDVLFIELPEKNLVLKTIGCL